MIPSTENAFPTSLLSMNLVMLLLEMVVMVFQSIHSTYATYNTQIWLMIINIFSSHHTDLVHAGGEELTDDVTEDGEGEDAGVPPLEVAWHEGNQSNLNNVRCYFESILLIMTKVVK